MHQKPVFTGLRQSDYNCDPLLRTSRLAYAMDNPLLRRTTVAVSAQR